MEIERHIYYKMNNSILYHCKFMSNLKNNGDKNFYKTFQNKKKTQFGEINLNERSYQEYNLAKEDEQIKLK